MRLANKSIVSLALLGFLLLIGFSSRYIQRPTNITKSNNMILIDLYLVCVNDICPKFDKAAYTRAEPFLERELKTDVKFNFIEKKIKISLDRPGKLGYKGLSDLDEKNREELGKLTPVVTRTPTHINGYIVSDELWVYGVAEFFNGGDSFYLHSRFGQVDKTVAHEVLHLFGFAHNQDPGDIMTQYNLCSAHVDIMDCTNHGQFTLPEAKDPNKRVITNPVQGVHIEQDPNYVPPIKEFIPLPLDYQAPPQGHINRNVPSN